MTRILSISWLLTTAATAAGLLAWGWHGGLPEVSDGNAWLAVLLATALSAAATVIPVGLLCAVATGRLTRPGRPGTRDGGPALG